MEEGVKDFDKYLVNPKFKGELLPDFFVDDNIDDLTKPEGKGQESQWKAKL